MQPGCTRLVQSQIPVVEQAIETAALMLGKDKSRGYCLEMICADFLAVANLDGGVRNSSGSHSDDSSTFSVASSRGSLSRK